jgi:ABC-type phosphate transport system permease subunit
VVKFKKQKQADFDLLNANSSKPKMSAGEISLKVLVYFLAIVVILVLLMLIVFVIFKSVTIFQVQGFFQFIFVDR